MKSKKLSLSITLAIAGLLALFLYWPSIRLPVVYDSLLHIRIARGLNLLSVWLPTEKFGFYRPLTFFPLLVIRGILNAYPAWLLHGLNVFQHALNAVLLAGLCWRLWRSRSRALIAGLLFGLFPFSYQAIAVYGHNVHPSTANLMLLGMHTYLNGVQSGKKRWWAATGVLFVLSLLSHETAVLFGPLAALVHWNFARQQPNASWKIFKLSDLFRPTPWLIFSLLGGAYALVYQLLPISRTPQALEQGNNLATKALYLAQAAVHPFAWFAHLLPNLSAVTIVSAGVILTLALTLWRALKKENRLALLLGFGWWGLASLVIALPLPTSYLLHGPRLLYLGSIGTAILWSTLLQPWETSTFRTDSIAKSAGRLVQAAALLFVLITNWIFVRGELALYTQLAIPLAQIKQVMQGGPPGDGVLLVNLPGWISPRRNTYAVGSEHVAIMGHHLFAGELVNVNLQASHPVRAVKLPELMSDPGYPFGIFGESDLSQPIPADWAAGGSQVFITSLNANSVETMYTGSLVRSSGEKPPEAVFGPYELVSSKVEQCNGSVQATTVWDLTGSRQPPAGVSLFMQLLDEQGQLVSQADGPPLGVRPDLIDLSEGWNIIDRRSLPAGKQVQMLIGVYYYATGERLPAYDAQHESMPDNALRLPVSVCPMAQ